MTNIMRSHSFVMEKEIEVTEVNRQTVVTRDWGEQGKSKTVRAIEFRQIRERMF